MLRPLADGALTRPWAMLAGVVAVLGVSLAVASEAADPLALTPPEVEDSESARGADELAGALGREPAPGMVIITEGKPPVRSGVYRVALDVIASAAKADPEVAEVRRGAVSRDGRTTALGVLFRDRDPGTQQRAIERIEAELDPGPLEVSVGGEEAILLDARESLGGELGGLELLALPLVVLVLLAAFGPRLVAGPILAAATAASASVALLRLGGGVEELSLLALAPATAVALIVSTESCLTLARRYREEAETAGPGEEALRRTLGAAAPGVGFASLAGAAASAVLAAVPVLDARSVALGGALGALLAGGAALVTMPSLLALAPRAGARRWAALPVSGWAPRGAAKRWVWLARVLSVRRPLAAPLVLVPAAVLVALAVPVIRSETIPIGATDLPRGAEARQAQELASAELDLEIGGSDAAARDSNDVLFDRLPIAAGIHVLVIATLLFLLLRSPPLSAALAVASLLPAAAAVGLLDVVFGDGRLNGLLDYSPQRGAHLAALVGAAAALGAVSAARSAQFARALAVERELGFEPPVTIARAAALTLPAAATGTVIGAAAAGVLAGADLVPAKELGLAIAAGLLLDLALVRVVLAPALARLAGYGAS